MNAGFGSLASPFSRHRSFYCFSTLFAGVPARTRATPLASSAAELAAVIRNLCAGRHGDPEIGMTENEAVGTSWCYPIKTNETISAGHVRRQLVLSR
jgi:hypothetical protein